MVLEEWVTLSRWVWTLPAFAVAGWLLTVPRSQGLEDIEVRVVLSEALEASGWCVLLRTS